MPICFFDTKKLSVGINCLPEKENSLEVGGKTLFDLIYPVGSIYLSVSSVNPEAFFGGSWVRWGNGKTIVAVDENDSQGYFPRAEWTGEDRNHSHLYAIKFSNWYGANGLGCHKGHEIIQHLCGFQALATFTFAGIRH